MSYTSDWALYRQQLDGFLKCQAEFLLSMTHKGSVQQKTAKKQQPRCECDCKAAGSQASWHQMSTTARQEQASSEDRGPAQTEARAWPKRCQDCQKSTCDTLQPQDGLSCTRAGQPEAAQHLATMLPAAKLSVAAGHLQAALGRTWLPSPSFAHNTMPQHRAETCLEFQVGILAPRHLMLVHI